MQCGHPKLLYKMDSLCLIGKLAATFVGYDDKRIKLIWSSNFIIDFRTNRDRSENSDSSDCWQLFSRHIRVWIGWRGLTRNLRLELHFSLVAATTWRFALSRKTGSTACDAWLRLCNPTRLFLRPRSLWWAADDLERRKLWVELQAVDVRRTASGSSVLKNRAHF